MVTVVANAQPLAVEPDGSFKLRVPADMICLPPDTTHLATYGVLTGIEDDQRADALDVRCAALQRRSPEMSS